MTEATEQQSMIGRVNVYICGTCRFATVTIHRDDGVTPFMIPCQHANCGKPSYSTFYRAPTQLAPTHEWYVPGVEETAALGSATKEHVAKGGLLLRPITRHDLIDRAAKRVVHAERTKAFSRPGGLPSGDNGLHKGRNNG